MRSEQGRLPWHWLLPGALGTWFLVLTGWSWRKWGDVYVDFGWQLELARSLANGKHLYRDISFVPGPVSQYLNALWFKLTGASFMSLMALNLCLTAVIAWLIFEVTKRLSSRFVGFLCSFFFLSFFAFSQFMGIGNHSYMAPYRHEATHAVLFCLIALLAELNYLTNARRRDLYLAGLFIGLAFLTKAEFSLAPIAMTGFFFAIRWFSVHRVKAVLAELARFSLAAALPSALFLIFLGVEIGFVAATEGIFRNWTILFSNSPMESVFVIQRLGWDRPSVYLLRVFWVSSLSGLILLALYLADRFGPALYVGIARLAPAFVAFIGLVALIQHGQPIDGALVGKTLAVLSASTLLFSCFKLARSQLDTQALERHRALCLWSAWSLIMMSKLGLRPTIYDYGFVLAMPATMLLITVLMYWIPEGLQRRHRRGHLFRALSLAFIIFFAGKHLLIADRIYGLKTFSVGEGANRLLDFAPEIRPHGELTVDALSFLGRETPEDSTLLVIPDGSLLNFLLQRDNPTPYYFLTPMDIDWFGGEEAVIAELEANSPETILIWGADLGEYGVPHFGYDPRSGQAIREWIVEHYEMTREIRARPTSYEGGLKGYRVYQLAGR